MKKTIMAKDKIKPSTDERIATPYGDVWFELGIHGERIPMYSDRSCLHAAIAAFLADDYGSLLVEEIDWFRESARDAGIIR